MLTTTTGSKGRQEANSPFQILLLAVAREGRQEAEEAEEGHRRHPAGEEEAEVVVASWMLSRYARNGSRIQALRMVQRAKIHDGSGGVGQAEVGLDVDIRRCSITTG